MGAYSSAVRAYVFLTGTSLCWGINAVLAQMAVDEVSPMLLVNLRWVGTLGLLLAVSWKSTCRDWPILKENLRMLCLMGALGFTVFNALFYLAAHTTTALNIGIIQGATPIFILVGALLAYRTEISRHQIAGILVTMVGVCLVVSLGEWQRLLSLTFQQGDLLMIIACLFHAGYTVAVRQMPKVSPLSVFTVLAAAAFVTSIPLGLMEHAQGNMQWPTVKGSGVVLLVILLPSFLAQLFYIQGIALIGPGRSGIFVNLIPVFAAFFAIVFLQETFEMYHAIALLLVLGGIALSEFRKTEK